MSRMYPHALWSCIAENRNPRPDELAGVVEKIWREAYGTGRDSGDCQRAATIARAALIGTVMDEDVLRSAA